MMTSAMLKNGIDYMETVLADLRNWMEEHEYESIRQMQGSMSRQNGGRPDRLQPRQLPEGPQLLLRPHGRAVV